MKFRVLEIVLAAILLLSVVTQDKLRSLYWQFDNGRNPAVIVDHEYTHLQDAKGERKESFEMGEDVYVVGRGTRLRTIEECPVEYVRTLSNGNLQPIELESGRGIRFDAGLGYGRVRLDHSNFSHPGVYRFTSMGYHKCNPDFPQVIKGWTTEIVVE